MEKFSIITCLYVPLTYKPLTKVMPSWIDDTSADLFKINK
jgi:hypothetical protein